jgi:calcineurin-like phosphoesterase family protein
MNEALIANWNARVTPKDEVYVIGDFAFNRAVAHASRLNGKKHLVIGNHDKDGVIRALTESGQFVWAKPYYEFKRNNQLIVLCHYAMRVWNKMHHGACHLFGHSHGNMPSFGKSFDIGVDSWNYTPVSFEEVMAKMDALDGEYLDHHRKRPDKKTRRGN